MSKHKVKWVDDHTQICDRLDERIRLMQDYLDSKPDDFDGIATKRFLLGQAREQVTWYRPRHRIQTRPRLPDLAADVVATRSR